MVTLRPKSVLLLLLGPVRDVTVNEPIKKEEIKVTMRHAADYLLSCTCFLTPAWNVSLLLRGKSGGIFSQSLAHLLLSLSPFPFPSLLSLFFSPLFFPLPPVMFTFFPRSVSNQLEFRGNFCLGDKTRGTEWKITALFS